LNNQNQTSDITSASQSTTPQRIVYQAAKARTTRIERAQKWLRNTTILGVAVTAVSLVGFNSESNSVLSNPTTTLLNALRNDSDSLTYVHGKTTDFGTFKSSLTPQQQADINGLTNAIANLKRQEEIYVSQVGQLRDWYAKAADTLEKSPQNRNHQEKFWQATKIPIVAGTFAAFTSAFALIGVLLLEGPARRARTRQAELYEPEFDKSPSPDELVSSGALG
jgi:hypothetical protein